MLFTGFVYCGPEPSHLEALRGVGEGEEDGEVSLREEHGSEMEM